VVAWRDDNDGEKAMWKNEKKTVKKQWPYLFLEQRCGSHRYLDMSVVTLGRANKAKARWKVKKLANEKQNGNNNLRLYYKNKKTNETQLLPEEAVTLTTGLDNVCKSSMQQRNGIAQKLTGLSLKRVMCTHYVAKTIQKIQLCVCILAFPQ